MPGDGSRLLIAGALDPVDLFSDLGGPAPSLLPTVPPPGFVLVAVARQAFGEAGERFVATAILSEDPGDLAPLLADVKVLYFHIPSAALAATFPVML